MYVLIGKEFTIQHFPRYLDSSPQSFTALPLTTDLLIGRELILLPLAVPPKCFRCKSIIFYNFCCCRTFSFSNTLRSDVSNTKLCHHTLDLLCWLLTINLKYFFKCLSNFSVALPKTFFFLNVYYTMLCLLPQMPSLKFLK